MSAAAVDLDALRRVAGEVIAETQHAYEEAVSVAAQRAARARHQQLVGEQSNLVAARQAVLTLADRVVQAKARAAASQAAWDAHKRELAQAEAECERLEGIKSPQHQRAWQTSQSLTYAAGQVEGRAIADTAQADDLTRRLGEAQARLEQTIARLQALLAHE